MKKILFILFVVLFSTTAINSQTVENVSASLDNGKVIINYDLNSQSLKAHKVKIYCSVDDYKTPLKEVQGDVGKVLKGANKQIIWDYQTEYPNQGLDDVDFKVVATLPKKAAIITGVAVAGGILATYLVGYYFYWW